MDNNIVVPININFQEQAQKILEELEDIAEEADKQKILSQLKPICAKFSIIYDFFFTKEIEYQQAIDQYRKILQHLNNFSHALGDINDDPNLGVTHKAQNLESLRESRTGLIRQLETLLTAFKSVFLKVLERQFVQVIVVEVINQQGEIIPQLMQMQNWNELAGTIKSEIQGLQGKLISNDRLAARLKADKHQCLLRNIADNNQTCQQIYSQTRRRLNVFYSRTNRPAYGQALLLYKPGRHWIRFYVNNLGDLKEGYVAMLLRHRGNFPTQVQRQVQYFAENFIGLVDSVEGTLLQDVQLQQGDKEDYFQISVKSGGASTGSHRGIIQLIKNIGDMNSNDNPFILIQEAFQKDEGLSKSGFGKRNRILDPKKDKDKLASLLTVQGSKQSQITIRSLINDINLTN